MSGTVRLGKTLAGLFALRAITPIIFYLLGWIVSIAFPGNVARYASHAFDGIKGLLGLACGVVLLVWLYKLFDKLAGQTKYGPGMAVGGWFIPVANLALPAMILRDAWRALHQGRGGLAVVGWWLAYLAYIFCDLSLTLFNQMYLRVDAFFVIVQSPVGRGVLMAFGLITVLLEVVAFATIGWITLTLSKKLAETTTASVPPGPASSYAPPAPYGLAAVG